MENLECTCVITIKDIIANTYIGILPFEKIKKQKVKIDIKISTQDKACITDSLQDTICYDSIIQQIQEICLRKKFNLIEHLAYVILQEIKIQNQKHAICITVTKFPKIKGFNGPVSFTIRA